VVNLVHVRFISDYYRIPPERVFEVRGHHPDIVAVNYEVSRSRSRHDDDDDQGHDEGNHKGKGKHGNK